jgi:tetratricopeptide (TPR) repeat protein
MKALNVGFVLLLGTLFQVTAPEVKALTSEQWLEDLEFVTSELESLHPNPYYKIDEVEFDSVVAESRSAIAQSESDLECYLAIKRVVAAIEDGHTQLLEDGIFNLLDLRFPFRVDEFTDGVYITLIDKEHEVYLGSRVTAVNDKPIESVLRAIEEVVSSDNEFRRKYVALNGVSFARILNGLEIIDNTDHIELQLTTRDGATTELTLPSMLDDSNIDFDWSTRLNIGPTGGEYVGPFDTLGEKQPLYARYQGDRIRFYWFEHLADDRAVYLQVNQVMDQPDHDETFSQFSARMWDYIDRNAGDIDKLIIDLRFDNGGNALVVLPFINEIMKRDYINREGGLFVISGKRTYSAASIFMYELAVHTQAIVVGEPDGCGSDLFSNSRLAGNLPNSGFPLWIPRLWFTSRWPVDNPEYFMPRFPAPFSSHDYFNGSDPAMSLILGEPDFRSVAEFAADEGAQAALAHYRELKEKYEGLEWWKVLDPEILEESINREGYALMSTGDLERAFQVLTLNTMLFPSSSNVWDSLGECSYSMKQLDLSLEYYRRSIELNPDNEGGKQMIERIKEEQMME